MPRRERCDPPACKRVVSYFVSGIDGDGREFADRCCETCTAMLLEEATLMRLPITATPVEAMRA